MRGWSYRADVPAPESTAATTVTVTPATAELAALGATVRLSAQVLDQNGQAMAGAPVGWSSSATSVATVTASGLVTALVDGVATITATAGSASGICRARFRRNSGLWPASNSYGSIGTASRSDSRRTRKPREPDAHGARP